MGRSEQVKVALPINLLFMLEAVKHVAYYIVTFGDDTELIQWIMDICAYHVKQGYLVVASGGRVGLQLDNLTIDEGMPDPIFPALRHTATMSGLPVMVWWHASTAKNTSHMLAIRDQGSGGAPRASGGGGAPRASGGGGAPCASGGGGAPCGSSDNGLDDLMLLNVDCDNVTTRSFIHHLSNTIDRHGKAAEVRMVWRRHGNPGTCGRIAAIARDWLAVGGYDEEAGIVGSGYQDVDLVRRFEKQFGAIAHMESQDVFGVGIPNSQDWSVDRNGPKIRNCAEQELAAHASSWLMFNVHNVHVMKEKLKTRSNKVRNQELGGRLGAYFRVCPMTGAPAPQQKTSAAVEAAPAVEPIAQHIAPAPEASAAEPRVPATAAVAAEPPATADRHRMRVDVLSFGLRFVGQGRLQVPRIVGQTRDEFQDNQLAIMRMGDRKSQPGDVKTGIRAAGLAGKDDEVVDIDCRVFADPGAQKKGGTNHVGAHQSIIAGIVNHQVFPAFLTHAAKCIYTTLGNKHEHNQGYVVCYCMSGRHRSVAIAMILAECIKRGNLWVLGNTEHLSKGHRQGWAHTCNCCEECKADPGGTREACYQRAFSIWQGAVRQLSPVEC